eukprot:m.5223 g.5223  ORF g.5223 m.5223 type:complete len:73 (+) comp2362_c0_seq1:880-1098(+)
MKPFQKSLCFFSSFFKKETTTYNRSLADVCDARCYSVFHKYNDNCNIITHKHSQQASYPPTHFTTQQGHTQS